jgi:hypothetical protein
MLALSEIQRMFLHVHAELRQREEHPLGVAALGGEVEVHGKEITPGHILFQRMLLMI